MKVIYITLFVFLLFDTSCGDIFQSEKHIIGPYYAVEGQTHGHISICYLTNNGMLPGKIPPSVKEYGIVDSFLVAKVIEQDSVSNYYILNMNKDSELAKNSDFLIGPLNEREYYDLFGQKNKIIWHSVY